MVSFKSFKHFLDTHGRCSALVKILKTENRYIDLFVGHTTWEELWELNRSMKRYNFRLKGTVVEAIFSSYPGTLSSTDDFYVTNHKLVVTETTISEVGNTKPLDPEKYYPNFMRVNAATFFAKSAVLI